MRIADGEVGIGSRTEPTAGFIVSNTGFQLIKCNGSDCANQPFVSTFTVLFNQGVAHVVNDGLTFVLVVHPLEGLTGGYIGYGVNYTYTYPSFAVEFDTFQDTVFNDINDNHVGIDIRKNMNSLFVSDIGTLGFRLNDGLPTYMFLSYNGTHLSVSLSEQDVQPAKPLFVQPFDFIALFGAQDTVVVPGFSAASGTSLSPGRSVLESSDWDLDSYDLAYGSILDQRTAVPAPK